jgi:predicted phage terminase large subunit-like protein
MLTTSDKNNIKNDIRRELHKRSFYDFVKWAATIIEPNTKWSWNFHHEYLCDVLQKETIRIKNGEPKVKNIIINVPFRSSKSLITSICYPIWSFIVNPNMSFINLSYSDDLATDHSNKLLSLITSIKFRELYVLEMDDIQRSKSNFKLKTGGSRISGGMLSVLGKGADVIILDDPNNSRKLSDIERRNTINSWRDTISTRLNDPNTGIFIVIQQRLHSRDLSGYLLDTEPENWNRVVLPAVLTKNVQPAYLAEKYVDGLLWGDRFSRKVLDNFLVVLGSKNYSNQLLQETSPAEGNIIKKKWIKIITHEEFETILESEKIKKVTWDLFVDSAQTEKKKNDPSGILIATKIRNKVYVRKGIEKRLEFPQLIKELKKTVIAFGNNNSRIMVEPKSNGKDIVNQLRHESTFNVLELPSPKDDKETRLNAVSPLIESGRLIFIEDTTNDNVVNQLTMFPTGSVHDEFVDLVGYALTKYIKRNSSNYLML